jgi:8-oxo-dGTP pyrophosphatase MutT (NUDIX family)
MQHLSTGGLVVSGDRSILLLQRSATDDFLPGYWDIPGGGVEHLEDIAHAVAREIREECGFEVVVNVPVVNSYGVNLKNRLVRRFQITLLCHPANHSFEETLSREHDSYKWDPLDSIQIVDLSPYMSGLLTDAVNHL